MGTEELGFLRDRVSRIEGGYEHLATKADLKDLENRLMRTLIGVVALATTIIIAVQRFWPRTHYDYSGEYPAVRGTGGKQRN